MSSLIHFPVNEKFSKRAMFPPPDGGCISRNSVTEVQSSEVDQHEFNTIQQPEFDYRFTTEQLRRQSLKHSRNWFSALVLLLAIVATVCAYAGIPYQPFVATDIAALGIVVVLAMKNWEGRS